MQNETSMWWSQARLAIDKEASSSSSSSSSSSGGSSEWSSSQVMSFCSNSAVQWTSGDLHTVHKPLLKLANLYKSADVSVIVSTVRSLLEEGLQGQASAAAAAAAAGLCAAEVTKAPAHLQDADEAFAKAWEDCGRQHGLSDALGSRIWCIYGTSSSGGGRSSGDSDSGSSSNAGGAQGVVRGGDAASIAAADSTESGSSSSSSGGGARDAQGLAENVDAAVAAAAAGADVTTTSSSTDDSSSSSNTGSSADKLADSGPRPAVLAAKAFIASIQVPLLDVGTALAHLGLALTAVAFPQACNDPQCRVLAGPSEQQLVGGCECVCGGCRVACYCDRGCQSKHWKQHKAVCKALVAAAAEP